MILKLRRLISILVLVTFLLPGISTAATVDCGVRVIKNIWIGGNRDDNSPHANSMMLFLEGGLCNNGQFVHIDNNAPAYQSMVRAAMEAYVTGMRIHLFVNTSQVVGGSTEIATFALVK